MHCETFLSDYFMKHSLMYISLHLIWFHEIGIKHVKWKPPGLRKKEFKRSLRPATLLKKRFWGRCFPVKFLKHLFYRTPLDDCFCRMEKKSAFLRKQGNSTKECHIIPGKYVNLYQNKVSNFARLLGVCPPHYNQEHVNILRKANF